MSVMSAARHFPSNRNSRLARIVRAVFDRGRVGWTFKIHVGPSAGYGRWIFNRRVFLPTGWTLWLGRNVQGGIVNGERGNARPWSAGITRNGNAAPWAAQ